MSDGSWRKAYVGCPFYRGDDAKKKITCDGVVPDTAADTRFRSRKERERHMDLFCCKNYICCEVYRANMANCEED